MNRTGDAVSFVEKADKVLERAMALLPKVGSSWAEFSNALFDQKSGLVPLTFADPMELQAFWDSDQYKSINNMLLHLMKEHGTDGANPKNGRVLVRLPQTLHKALIVEARHEKTSLNQLIVSKVAFPLREMVEIPKKTLVQAFAEVHDGYSTERVVVDPLYNMRFLTRCRELDLAGSDYWLNHKLYDIRKSCKGLLPATTKKTEFRDFDAYRFAAEIGVRVLQRTEGVSLDHILCDPLLVKKFDDIVQRLTEVPSVLKLRWAALNLRKTHMLQREDSEAPQYMLDVVRKISTLDMRDLPEREAAYALYDHNWPIYAGETENLRKRIERHINYGISVADMSSLTLRIHTNDDGLRSQDSRMRWLRWFINKERPLLNYQKVA